MILKIIILCKNYNIINHQDLKFMDLKNMALVIGLDGVELVPYTIIRGPQFHKYQE
jgi:hypothetical protein